MLKLQKKQISIVLSVALITACSHGGSGFDASKQNAVTGAVTPVTQYCSDCHRPPKARVHTADEWPYVIERMQKHRVKKGKQRLNETEQRAVLDYLLSH